MDEPALPSTFSYLPLDTSVDTIRLLELMPISKFSYLRGIDGRLIHSTFADLQDYIALSYTWGNNEAYGKKTISLNGNDFEVRENLFWALSCLRTRTKVVIWVDAICIDQSNIEERNYQVGLMPFIYNRAERVIIWLGLPSALQERSKKKKPIRYKSDSEESESVEKKDEVTVLFEDMPYLCGLEYWRRAWIVQEIGLSRDLRVHYGSSFVKWETFMSLMHRSGASRSTKIISKLDANRRERHASQTLERLLIDFQTSKCQDTRDRVYAFLGLAHDCLDGNFQADYTKTTTQIYFDLIKHFHRDLARQPPDENGAISVKTKMSREMGIVGFSALIQKLFQADPVLPHSLGEANYIAGFSPKDTVLAKGIVLGKIECIGPICQDIIQSHRADREWKLQLGQSSGSKETKRKLNESNEAYLPKIKEMIKNDFMRIQSIPPQRWYSRATTSKLTWRDVKDPKLWTTKVQNGRLSPNGDDTNLVIEATQQAHSTVRLFIGNTGFIGMAPDIARVGDMICQFWSNSNVVILRPDERFKFTSLLRIVGRANLSTGALDENMRPIYNERLEPSGDSQIVDIQMSIETLACLTS
jgi:hypothetical protein